MNQVAHTKCPDESVLEKIAAGVCPPEVEIQALQHAALCNVCGPRLRRYLKIFSPAQPSEGEAALVSQLQTSQPEWQRDWVRKNVAPSVSDRAFIHELPPAPWWRKFASASAAMFKPLALAPRGFILAVPVMAVVILAVLQGPTIAGHMQIQSAQSRVASGFAERRTTEMRLTSVGYAPYQPFPTELGGESERDLNTL